MKNSHVSPIQPFDHIPVFNPDILTQYFSGIPDSLTVFCSCFVEMRKRLAERLDHLQSAIVNEKIEDVSRVAHLMKGSFRVTGGDRLAFLCEELEREASQFSGAELMERCQEVRRLSEDFEREVETFLREKNIDLSQMKLKG